MTSLRTDGWRIIREGRTTVDEVMRNTKDEEAGGAFADLARAKAAAAAASVAVADAASAAGVS
jgi:hypothetical protein